MITTADGKKEKHYWCGQEKCRRWTLSHNISGHGLQGNAATRGKPPKADNLKLQLSLKTFLSTANNSKNKLSCKDRQQLQALLTAMKHNEESDAASVESK
jgi:hypothetical protein